SDRHRGETDIDIERYRYGFVRRSAAGPVAVVPPNWLDTGVTAIRPFLLLEKGARDVRTFLEKLAGRPRDRTDAEREAAIMTEKERQDALVYWQKGMGTRDTISAEEVAVLDSLIDRLLASREQVVLVDLPIPAWHRDASPYSADYKRRLEELVRRFAG